MRGLPLRMLSVVECTEMKKKVGMEDRADAATLGNGDVRGAIVASLRSNPRNQTLGTALTFLRSGQRNEGVVGMSSILSVPRSEVWQDR